MPRRNRRAPQSSARPVRLIPAGALRRAARAHLDAHAAALALDPAASSVSGDPDADWPVFCSVGAILDRLAVRLAGPVESSDAAGNLAV